jgi:hypothetical protein
MSKQLEQLFKIDQIHYLCVYLGIATRMATISGSNKWFLHYDVGSRTFTALNGWKEPKTDTFYTESRRPPDFTTNEHRHSLHQMYRSLWIECEKKAMAALVAREMRGYGIEPMP